MTKFILKCATCLARTTLPDPSSLFTAGWEARPATGDWICPACAAADTSWTVRDDLRLMMLLRGNPGKVSLPLLPPVRETRMATVMDIIGDRPWSYGRLALWQLRPSALHRPPPETFLNYLIQRDDNGAHKLDRALFGTLFVSRRGEDDYVILDGVVRWTALCHVAVDPVGEEVSCFTVEGLTRQEEAQLHVAMNSDERRSHQE